MPILVVEDEPKLNQIIVDRLKKEHYTVDGVMGGNEAMACLCCAQYDAVVLDIMLPGQSGIQVLRNPRESGDKTPVLLLTARDKVEDRVDGLDAGADDYLVKPFAFEEFLARVRVLIRRGAGDVSNVFTLADLAAVTMGVMICAGHRQAVAAFRQGLIRGVETKGESVEWKEGGLFIKGKVPSFEGGIHYSMHDGEGKLLWGEVPSGFDENKNFISRYTHTVESGGVTWQVYDAKHKTRGKNYIRIRGIIQENATGTAFDSILKVAFAALPLSIFPAA